MVPQQIDNEQHPVRSPYEKGASDGLLMGGFLSVVFVLQAIGLRLPLLGLLGEVMLLGIPILAFFMLRRSYRHESLRSHFSALWMHGIMMFLCGGLILALVVYFFLRVVDPEFIINQVRMAIDVYTQLGTAQGQSIADTLQRMIDRHLLPTPMTMTFSTLWLTGFLGALLSLILSGIIKFFVKK